MINQFEDWVLNEKWIDGWGPPVFSKEEIEALRKFYRVWVKVAAEMPARLPPLEETLKFPEWDQLRFAAEEALSVFNVRGFLSEELEI
jgi:hypothetical protein